MGRAVATSDILSDPRLTVSEARRRALTSAGIRAAAAVPVRSRDRSIGAGMMGFPDCRVLSEDELRLACQCAVNGDCTVSVQPEFNWYGENFWQKPYPNK